MLSENNLSAQCTDYGMGTVMVHRGYGEHINECLTAIRQEIIQVEDKLSRFLPESEISRINRSAGIQCEQLSSNTFSVLTKAAEFSDRYHGFFDITIGPLVNLWNSCRDTGAAPDDSRIKQSLALIDCKSLELEPFKQTGILKKAGQSIDLGGIGKGFIGDRILQIYEEYGISSAYSNLGGNVVTVGRKLDGSPWHIGIQHPRKEDCLLGAVAVEGKTVVTSGDYQRFYIGRQGSRFHHILNPSTGYPSDSGLISVSIVTTSSLEADALSTILFVAGMEMGFEILKTYPGTEAIFVDSDMRVFITQGLQESFQGEEDITVNIIK